jgi:hypothetical protein
MALRHASRRYQGMALAPESASEGTIALTSSAVSVLGLRIQSAASPSAADAILYEHETGVRGRDRPC